MSPFIAERRGKKGRGEARYCINSGGRYGVALANEEEALADVSRERGTNGGGEGEGEGVGVVGRR